MAKPEEAMVPQPVEPRSIAVQKGARIRFRHIIVIAVSRLHP